jgi:pyruvate dehydrogenase E1 component alpha subunit
MMSMGTHLHRHSWTTDLTLRGGPAYGMPGISIEANDIELTYRTVREAADRARAGEGSTFIEAKTYRFRGHSMSDPAKYRTKEELESYKSRDPIGVYEQILKERGWIDDEQIEELHEKIKVEIEEAIEFAENAPEPPLEAVYEDISVGPYIPQE